MRQALLGLAAGLLFWSAFSFASSATEPWDGQFYWSVAYPASLLGSAALGHVFGRRAWITGCSLTFAQFPIIAADTGLGLLSLFAIAVLGVLALPAVLAARVGAMRFGHH